MTARFCLACGTALQPSAAARVGGDELGEQGDGLLVLPAEQRVAPAVEAIVRSLRLLGGGGDGESEAQQDRRGSHLRQPHSR